MKNIYSSPFRVYLILGAFALFGVLSGFRLPVSLFPNSTKPTIYARISYGPQSAEEFLNTFGKPLESILRTISTESLRVERLRATYEDHSVKYEVEFEWGASPISAKREVQNAVNGYAARLSQESRDSVRVWMSSSKSGFYAMALYSESRSLNELYHIVEPILAPRLLKVQDAQDPVIWNPESQEISVQLKAEAMAALQLVPRNIEDALLASLNARTGGSVQIGDRQLQIEMPRTAADISKLETIPVPTPTGKVVYLGDLAHVDYGPKTMDAQIWKASGTPSLIVFATPKPGGNIKQMSEDIFQTVKEALPALPKDLKYQPLVDPSEFIRAAINNVLREVLIAACLAVLVLFLFIGSVRNVITAAIEIPISMVLAFILMRLFGMNLNLISLAGLALSAGMNVDGSVVVMENIFRHFDEHPGAKTLAERLDVVANAVSEVRMPILASTLCSLVVFLPLIFTSALTYAILGDLAKAVVFSHSFSAIVALILVPTIRLHLMSKGDIQHPTPPLERFLLWLENRYEKGLRFFLNHFSVRWFTYGSAAAILTILLVFVLPHLPKEIIGMPDTDFLWLDVQREGNSLMRQMEGQIAEVEDELLKLLKGKVRYTFSETESPNSASVLVRLLDKRQMAEVWKMMEAKFVSQPAVKYEVGPWNPSELPIPDPPQFEVSVRGGDPKDRSVVGKEISDLLQDHHTFGYIRTYPDVEPRRAITFLPKAAQWAQLRSENPKIAPEDLADILRVASQGRRVGFFPMGEELVDLVIKYPQGSIQTIEDIEAFPVLMNGKMIPLRALFDVHVSPANPEMYREGGRDLVLVDGRENYADKPKGMEDAATARKLIEAWDAKRAHTEKTPTILFEDPAKELTQALHELSTAIGLSVLLIFLTLLLQFGSIMESLVVLTAVPLGVIGVIFSLFVFKSTVSLNSILGIILLNGIAVANSIILVDFTKVLVDRDGLLPKEAALRACKKRLRPILITSLTTVLGMLPVALGLGEGGKILQPLGIAVSGGLWCSMLLTLFLVPALHVAYLSRQKREIEVIVGEPSAV